MASLPKWQIEEGLLDHITNNSMTNTTHAKRMKESIPNKARQLTMPHNMGQVFLRLPTRDTTEAQPTTASTL